MLTNSVKNAGILSVLLAVLVSFPSHAKLVQARGLSEFEEGKIVEARRIAIEAAKREAVEQVMGTFVRARTDVNNYAIASDQIYSNTAGQINEYRLVEDGVNADGIYEVLMEADIDVNLMITSVNDLQASFGWLKKPRFAVLIDDATNNVAISEHARGILTKQLLKERFGIFDDTQALSAGFIIDLLISTNTQESDYRGMSINSNEIVLNASVRRAGDERVIASVVETANKPGANPYKVLTKLVEKMMRKSWRSIRKQTMRFWKEEQLTASTILFDIQGVEDLETAEQIKQTLVEIAPAIQNIELNRLDGGSLNFVVSYKGWVEQLYEELLAGGIKDKHGVVLTRVKGNRISASLG